MIVMFTAGGGRRELLAVQDGEVQLISSMASNPRTEKNSPELADTGVNKLPEGGLEARQIMSEAGQP